MSGAIFQSLPRNPLACGWSRASCT
ncbi:hypothetical protein [Amycolatopsis acidicola]